MFARIQVWGNDLVHYCGRLDQHLIPQVLSGGSSRGEALQSGTHDEQSRQHEW